MNSIRISVKAVIVENGKILLLRHADREGDWYSLPGGGQEPGESLLDALVRECEEEIGAVVRPGNVRFIRDYIGRNHEFEIEDFATHQVEIMFDCRVPEGYAPRNGAVPDATQKDVVWIELAALHEIRLFPKKLTGRLQSGERRADRSDIYLGDVN